MVCPKHEESQAAAATQSCEKEKSSRHWWRNHHHHHHHHHHLHLDGAPTDAVPQCNGEHRSRMPQTWWENRYYSHLYWHSLEGPPRSRSHCFFRRRKTYQEDPPQLFDYSENYN